MITMISSPYGYLPWDSIIVNAQTSITGIDVFSVMLESEVNRRTATGVDEILVTVAWG